jgi:hypothetical protein
MPVGMVSGRHRVLMQTRTLSSSRPKRFGRGSSSKGEGTQARTDVALLAAIGRVGPNRSVRLHRSQSFFAVSLDFLAAEGAVSAPNDPCCEGRRYPVIPQECSATIAHPTSFPNADDLF